MKKVLTTLIGGLPLTMDELGTAQDNVKELTSEVGKGLAFGETVLKVEGIDAVITNSGGATPTADISSGLFWYLDELYIFDAVVALALPAGMTDVTFGTTYEFDLSVTTNTPVTFNNALSKDIVELRKTILTDTPTTWTGLTYTNSLSLIDNIYDKFPSATDEIEGRIEIATDTETQIGTDTDKAVTPAGLKSITGGLITKTFELGAWNMDATASIQVNISEMDNGAIRMVQCIIKPDDPSSSRRSLEQSGYITTFENNKLVALYRDASGTFDTAGFDDAVINRGYLTIHYEV